MSDTVVIKKINEYVIGQISEMFSISLKPIKIPIGKMQKLKEYNGVTSDRKVVVHVINHGGRTAGGNIPSAKIKGTYAECYFLNLSNASRKILAFTNEEFYKIFLDNSKGLLGDIETVFIKLPPDLNDLVKNIIQEASNEMTIK